MNLVGVHRASGVRTEMRYRRENEQLPRDNLGEQSSQEGQRCKGTVAALCFCPVIFQNDKDEPAPWIQNNCPANEVPAIQSWERPEGKGTASP